MSVQQFKSVPAESVRAAFDLQSRLAKEGLQKANTTIEDFRASKTRPVVDEMVYFEGYVKWHLFPCFWYGVEGDRCILKVDEKEVTETITGKDGYFKIAYVFKAAGKYYVKARFPGSLTLNPSESLPIEITVLTEEEKKEEETRFWLLVGGIGAAVVIGVVGVAAYMEESRRRELMLAALARR
jgi:hypothetical protein